MCRQPKMENSVTAALKTWSACWRANKVDLYGLPWLRAHLVWVQPASSSGWYPSCVRMIRTSPSTETPHHESLCQLIRPVQTKHGPRCLLRRGRTDSWGIRPLWIVGNVGDELLKGTTATKCWDPLSVHLSTQKSNKKLARKWKYLKKKMYTHLLCWHWYKQK